MDCFPPPESSWLLAYINKSQQVITQMTYLPRNTIKVFHLSLQAHEEYSSSFEMPITQIAPIYKQTDKTAAGWMICFQTQHPL